MWLAQSVSWRVNQVPPLCFATTAEVSVDCNVEWHRAYNVGLNDILNESVLYVA